MHCTFLLVSTHRNDPWYSKIGAYCIWAQRRVFMETGGGLGLVVLSSDAGLVHGLVLQVSDRYSSRDLHYVIRSQSAATL